MPKPKVVYFWAISDGVRRAVAGQAPPDLDVQCYPRSTPDEEKARLAADADFLLWHGGPLSESVMRACRKARLIQVLSAGYEGVNLKLAGELGIPVASNGGGNSVPVAEHTIALILALYRRLSQCDRSTRQGTWRDAVMDGMNTYLLADKTVGIVGLGNIGKKVARRLKPFETRLIYNDLLAFPDYERELDMPRVSLNELLRRSDIVTLHVPLTSKTRGFIGRREFGLMKPTAILINTCRGSVVDETALVEALQRGRILGAGLDVFAQEPLKPDNPLTRLDNVVLSPHAAGFAHEVWAFQADLVFGNILRVHRGQPPEWVVTPEQ